MEKNCTQIGLKIKKSYYFGYYIFLAPFYLQTHLELNQIYLKYTGRKFHKHSKGLNLIKIGLKIKIQNFGCWSHFDPLYILETVRAIVSILYKENFIMNIKKKTSLRLVETLTLHLLAYYLKRIL